MDRVESTQEGSTDMQKQKAIHHTVADWDWVGPTNRDLDTGLYVSPPSSLRIGILPGISTVIGLCRVPDTLCIPNGRFQSWSRRLVIDNSYYWHFRNQAALGSADRQNTYVIDFSSIGTYLRYYLSGGSHSVASFDWLHPAGEWVHLRVTFEEVPNPANGKRLAVTLEREVAGQWLQLGNIAYENNNYWSDSAINRLGFEGYCGANYVNHLDDTKIYKKAG